MLKQTVHSCPKCGGTLKPRTSNQIVRCDYCGTELIISSPSSPILAQQPMSESASIFPTELFGLKRPKASGSWMNSLLTLVFAIPWTLCILLCFFIFGTHFWNEFQTFSHLNSEGITVRGTVMNPPVDDSGEPVNFNVYYRFTAPVNGDETTFEAIDNVSEQVYNKLEIGEAVDVIYEKSDPDTSAVKADWGTPDLWAPIFVFAIEFAGLAFGLWMLNTGIIAGSNYLNLRSKGEETQAIVFDCWEESSSDSSLYYVAYAYQIPGFGKEFFTNAEESIQAYKKLKIGDRVSLRYLPDNPKIAKLTGFNW